MQPAVFLDRDGTLFKAVPYLDRLEQVALWPWSVDAVRALNEAGYSVVVVTNQSGVARGLFDEAFVHETHRALDAKLKTGGARIDRYYYCPHHLNGSVEQYTRACDCRKPEPGMIRQATRELNLDAEVPRPPQVVQGLFEKRFSRPRTLSRSLVCRRACRRTDGPRCR